MNIIIFCTFDTPDDADFAMGELRHIPGVRSVRYVDTTPAGAKNARGSHGQAAEQGSGLYRTWPFALQSAVPAPIAPAPVTLRISCAEDLRGAVIAKLVNLRGTGIVSLR